VPPLCRALAEGVSTDRVARRRAASPDFLTEKVIEGVVLGNRYR
jgi:hypothetical protein